MWEPRGQRVLVTGASSGIGAAAALAFARLGVTVAVIARREEQLGAVLDACREHAPDSAMFVADLADLDAIPALVDQVTDTFGLPNVLVNNAGVPKRRQVAAMTLDDVESVMRMNYLSPVALTLGFLRGMRERGSGHVVNISSMGAHMVSFGVGAYAATKGALEYFTEAMYLELSASGVHAHVVVPGTTRSEFSTPKEGNDPPFPTDPATSVGPEVVADAIVACLSDDRFITYATEREQATSAAKNADPNGFLASMRERLAAMRR